MAAMSPPSDRVAQVLSLMKKGDDAFNRQDIAGMNAAHHPDIIAHMTGGDKPTRGRDALATALGGICRAFPDIHIQNDPYPVQFGDGDWMTVITRATGTFSGELALPNGKTIPGTGKSFDVTFSTTAKVGWGSARRRTCVLGFHAHEPADRHRLGLGMRTAGRSVDRPPGA